MTDADRVNKEYYAAEQAGRNDYWRYMAAPRWRVKVLSGLLAADPPAVAADLGCGDGALLEEVRRVLPNAELLGVDFAEAQLEKNRARRPDVRWAAADLSADTAALPEWAGRCDAVLATEIVEHLARPDRLLAHARALAKPGGRLLLSTQSGRVGETERRVGHRRHFTKEEMENLLREAGWKPVRVWNAGFPFHDLSKFLANLAPGASLEGFSAKPYGPAQKFVCAVLRGLFLLNSGRRGAQLFAVAEKA